MKSRLKFWVLLIPTILSLLIIKIVSLLVFIVMIPSSIYHELKNKYYEHLIKDLGVYVTVAVGNRLFFKNTHVLSENKDGTFVIIKGGN